MEKYANNHWVVISLIFFVMINGPILLMASTNQNNQNSEKQPKASGYERLEYNNYTATSGFAKYGVYWEFSSSNSNISITVIAMDNSDYTGFEYYVETAGYDLDEALTYVTKYTLSSGYLTEDNGTWDVPEQGTWYILFLHQDEDKTPIYLTYDLNYDPDTYDDYDPDLNASFLFPIIFGSIVAISIIFFIIFGIVQYNKTQNQKKYGKSKQWGGTHQVKKEKSARIAEQKRAQASQTNSSTQPKPLTRSDPQKEKKKLKKKDCRFCGEKIDADAKFCPWCGTNLK